MERMGLKGNSLFPDPSPAKFPCTRSPPPATIWRHPPPEARKWAESDFGASAAAAKQKRLQREDWSPSSPPLLPSPSPPGTTGRHPANSKCYCRRPLPPGPDSGSRRAQRAPGPSPPPGARPPAPPLTAARRGRCQPPLPRPRPRAQLPGPLPFGCGSS